MDDEILRPVRYGLLPTKSCPPFTVKVDTNDVSGRKGNNSKRASAARCSPSDNPPKLSPGWNKVALLTAARNSPCSCPFSVSLHPPQAALNSEPRKRWSLLVRFTSLHIKPALKGDSSRARPVGDAARGESGGIGSIASGSVARRPYSNQRCGERSEPEGL